MTLRAALWQTLGERAWGGDRRVAWEGNSDRMIAVPSFGAGLFLSMLLCLEIGRRLGIRRLARDPEGAMAGLGAVEGAVFGLYGLLIAFTLKVLVDTCVSAGVPRALTEAGHDVVYVADWTQETLRFSNARNTSHESSSPSTRILVSSQLSGDRRTPASCASSRSRRPSKPRGVSPSYPGMAFCSNLPR